MHNSENDCNYYSSGHPYSGEGTNNRMSLWTWPWYPKFGNGRRTIQQKRSIANSNLSSSPSSSLRRVARCLPVLVICVYVLSLLGMRSAYNISKSNMKNNSLWESDSRTKQPGELSLAVLVAGSTQRFLFDSFVEHVAKAPSRSEQSKEQQSLVHIDYFAVLTLKSGPAFRQDAGYMGHLAGRDRMFDGIEGLKATAPTITGDDDDDHSVAAIQREMMGAMIKAVHEASASSGSTNTQVRALRLLKEPIEDDPILDLVRTKEQKKHEKRQGDAPFDVFQQFPMMDHRTKALTRTQAGNKNMIRLFLALESLWSTEFLNHEQRSGTAYDYVLILRDDALWLDDFDLHAVVATDPTADAHVLSCDAREPKMLPPEICDHGILIRRSKADVVGAYVSTMARLDLQECHDSVTEWLGQERGCNSEMILKHALRVHDVRVKEVPQSALPFERAVRIESGDGNDTSNYYCYHKFCQSVDEPIQLPPEIQKCQELTF